MDGSDRKGTDTKAEDLGSSHRIYTLGEQTRSKFPLTDTNMHTESVKKKKFM